MSYSNYSDEYEYELDEVMYEIGEELRENTENWGRSEEEGWYYSDEE